MSYALRFLPEVQGDAIDGYAWYEDKAQGLGEDFLRVFYACAAEIPRNPLLHTKVHGDFRRRLMRRFPYAIYFRIEQAAVIVFGLFHCARNPKAIQRTLRGRDAQDEP